MESYTLWGESQEINYNEKAESNICHKTLTSAVAILFHKKWRSDSILSVFLFLDLLMWKLIQFFYRSNKFELIDIIYQ